VLVASIDSFSYKFLLLLHILSILVAFSPAFVNPLLSARLKKDGSSLLEHPKISGIIAKNSQTVYGPALALAGVFGIGMIFSSDKLYEFSQAWVSLAFVLWIAILGLVFGAIIPAEKKVAAGDASEEKHVAMFGGIAHLLLLLIVIDMIWKFGAPGT
jgi:uncharacterized membrane protein